MRYTVLIILTISLLLPAQLRAAPIMVEGGWYEPQLPIPVAHLEGSIEEVARAHGAILAHEPAARASLEYFAHAFERKLEHNARLAAHPWLRGLIAWTYRHFVRNILVDRIPERYRAAYAQFAKAAGVSEDDMLDAAVIPDASLRLLSLLYGTELAPVLPTGLGCTSIIWNSGPASALHGRNLDYDGVGYFDRHPLILHVIPNEGLAYVSVTSLGLHAPGLTAFNEAGLSLAVHQLTLTDTDAAGTPVAVISAEIIRNARSIEDAVAILRAFPRAGGWAYVLSQGRDRAVIETSASELAIRRSSEPFFFQTNHVSSPALASQQIFYSPGSWLDSFTRAGRLARIEQNGAAHGWATPEKLANMLGLGTVEGEAVPPRRVAGGLIAKLDNIQSVIMDGTHRRLWVARGDPTHAPNEKTYIEYRWSDLRSADEPEITGAEVTLVPSEALGKTGARLRELLRQALNARLTEEKPDYRLGLLRDYARLVKEQSKADGPPAGSWPGVYLHVWEELRAGELTVPALRNLCAELELALRDPDLAPKAGASEAIREARGHWKALGEFSRARVLDLLGRRSEALYQYYVVERASRFERLRKAAARGIVRPFEADEARALAIDWPGVDLYRY